MLLMNLLNLKNNFLQTINHNGRFEMEDEDMKISENEAKKLLLHSELYVSFCTEKNLKDILDKTKDGVELGYVSSLFSESIEFWKSKSKRLKLLISCKDFENFELNESSYEVKFNLSKNEGDQDYNLIITEDDWKKIVEDIHKCSNNAIIRFVLQIDDNNQIPILTIKYKDKNNIEIHRPLIQELSSNYLKKLIEDDLCFFYDFYTEMLFMILLGTVYEDSKQDFQTLLSKNNETFTIKSVVDGHSPVFLYDSNYIPNFRFFNEFNIKLTLIQEPTDTDVAKPASPNLDLPFGLKYIREKHAMQDKLSIQIDAYNRNKKTSKSLLIRPFPNTLYVNFNFPPIKAPTFEKESIDIFMEIEKLGNNSYEFKLYFSLDKLENQSTVFKKLEDSLNNIKLRTYGKTKDGFEDLVIESFSKNVESKKFQVIFSITPSEEPNSANKSIYDILENFKGFFSIQVCISRDIIMEYKVNISQMRMIVLSSNRLNEYIEVVTRKTTVSVNDISISSMKNDQKKVNTKSVRDLKTGDNNPNLGNETHKSTSPNSNDGKNVGKASVYKQENLNGPKYNDAAHQPKIYSSSKQTDDFIKHPKYNDTAHQRKTDKSKYNDTAYQPKTGFSINETDKTKINHTATHQPIIDFSLNEKDTPMNNNKTFQTKVDFISNEKDKHMNKNSKYNDKALQSEIELSRKKVKKQINTPTPNVKRKNKSTNGKFKITVIIIFVFIIGVMCVYFIFFR